MRSFRVVNSSCLQPRALSGAVADLVLVGGFVHSCANKAFPRSPRAATRCSAAHPVRAAGSSDIRDSRMCSCRPPFAFLSSCLSQSFGSMPSMQRCVLCPDSIAPRFLCWQRPPPNQPLQPAAGRSGAAREFMKANLFQSMLAAASGG
jgi:hypothetical protein